MAWYNTGAVSVTNGNATVTGSGTGWFGALQAGWGFVGPDGRTYEITNVVSNTELTLGSSYQGSTAAAQEYNAFPTMSLAGDLATQFQTIASNFQSSIDTYGSGRLPNGTESSPSMAFQSDADTGLFRAASNQLALAAGGVERMVVGSNVSFPDAISPNGGIQLGGTGAENNLSFFEEGTWTPVIQDTSANVAATDTSLGYYVRLGKMVFLTMEVTNINTTGLNGAENLQISGLPHRVDVAQPRSQGTLSLSSGGPSSTGLERLNLDAVFSTVLQVLGTGKGGAYFLRVGDIHATDSDLLSSIMYTTT